jgi:hypothetical protein
MFSALQAAHRPRRFADVAPAAARTSPRMSAACGQNRPDRSPRPARLPARANAVLLMNVDATRHQHSPGHFAPTVFLRPSCVDVK